MSVTYNQVIEDLRSSYDQMAVERDQKGKSIWKIEERARFLNLLQIESKQTLLEIGAGTGQDSLFFLQNGLDVVATDLSPEMVRHCREKGLTAYVADFANLNFSGQSFDAVYALNCLLHVPKKELPNILTIIRDQMKPNGLFYLGLYGGVDHEGIYEADHHKPKRFFARYLDGQIQAVVTQVFTLLDFHRVLLHDGQEGHFQSITLRRKDP